jgi:hypothetical protein
MSSKRKRYNAYRSSSDPLPPKRSRSRHLKALSESIHENIPEAFFFSPEIENQPDSPTLESFQSHPCSDSDSIVEETTIHGEIFNGQLLEVDTENIPDTSAESAINDSFLQAPEEGEMTTGEDPYVFPSCPLRLSESVLLIMTLALRHKLAGEALADIIHLVSLHCVPSPQSRPIKTLRELKQFFENAKGAVEQKFFCKFCHSLLPTNDVTVCPTCTTDLSLPSTKGYFLVAPIESQLKTFFSRKYTKSFNPNLLQCL